MCDQVTSNTIFCFFKEKILGSHMRVLWWPIIDNEIGNICGLMRNIHGGPK